LTITRSFGGVTAFLRAESDIEVIAEAANGEEGIERYRELRPDIVLMDLSVRQKLGVGDRTGAVTTALRRGFIRLD
jgi:NarL family two-component system response regulator LiaR